MQTFLPYPDFQESAAVLDQVRLGKQRVETFQIMQALFGVKLITQVREWAGIYHFQYYDDEGNHMEPEDAQRGVPHTFTREPVFHIRNLPREEWHFEHPKKAGWSNHPAVRMWRGHEWVLLEYQKAVCEEWTVEYGFKDTTWEKTAYVYFLQSHDIHDYHKPSWLGNEEFHISHQSNLIRKFPGYYKRRFPNVPDNIPYIWPV